MKATTQLGADSRPEKNTHNTDDCALDCPLMGRRTFIARSVLAAAAAALAACSASDPVSPFSGTFTMQIADYPALASVGGVALVSANGASLAVVRTSTDSFVALSRVCPHEGGRIDPSGSGFVCQKHGARFSSTGAWTGGQSTSSMRSYTTTYNSSTGTLTIG
jgi:nitrite reductase/ring-hydroxylating ferredoxin subunit